MCTFKEYLVWYNNRDVEPFVKAVSKQACFFADRGIDMFKDGLSIPGLTMTYLFQGLPRGVYFSLYGTENRSLHDLIKQNLVGGPSLVLHRYHEKTRLAYDKASWESRPGYASEFRGFMPTPCTSSL